MPAHQILVLNHVSEQRRPMQTCANAQTCQSLCCMHTLSMDVDECLDQKT